MPELPEVEVVRQGLETHVLGAQIRCVQIDHLRPVRNHLVGPESFKTLLTARTISAVRRRGKYLWFVLDDTDALVAHLGMSGQFRIHQLADEYHRHTRVRFELTDGRELRFIDQRMFGGFSFVENSPLNPVPHIAYDLFDPLFNMDEATKRLISKRTTIKRALLDQRLISGIGNIYADETLWRTRLYHEIPTRSLTKQQATAVLTNAKKVMADSLECGGTSFDSLYVNVNGESGYFERELKVYGREGCPCANCGHLIIRDRFMNRSSYRCPQCQPDSLI